MLQHKAGASSGVKETIRHTRWQMNICGWLIAFYGQKTTFNAKRKQIL